MIVTSEFLQLTKKASAMYFNHSINEDRTIVNLVFDGKDGGKNQYIQFESDKPKVENFSNWPIGEKKHTKRQPNTFYGGLRYFDNPCGQTLINALRKNDRIKVVWVLSNDNETIANLDLTTDECWLEIYRPQKRGREKFIGRFYIEHVTTNRYGRYGLLGQTR